MLEFLKEVLAMQTYYDYVELYLETPPVMSPDEEMMDYCNRTEIYPSDSELNELYTQIEGE